MADKTTRYKLNCFSGVPDKLLEHKFREMDRAVERFEGEMSAIYSFAVKYRSENGEYTYPIAAISDNIVASITYIREVMFQDKYKDLKFDAVIEAIHLGHELAMLSEHVARDHHGKHGTLEVLPRLADLISIIKSQESKMKAEAKPSMKTRAGLIADLQHFVTEDLKNDCNPTWEHVDYSNHIIKQPRFNAKDKKGKFILSEDSVREQVRQIFREYFNTVGGYPAGHRIAQGTAKYVPRPANRPTR